MATEFTPLTSLLGGGLIGLAAVLLMVTTGRIAGVSGIASRLLPPTTFEQPYGVAFIVGLLIAIPIYRLVTGGVPESSFTTTTPWLIVAGLCVGFGSVFGSGCTSGHGVCGLSRLSVRSLIATLTFMLTAFVTVFLIRHSI